MESTVNFSRVFSRHTVTYLQNQRSESSVVVHLSDDQELRGFFQSAPRYSKYPKTPDPSKMGEKWGPQTPQNVIQVNAHPKPLEGPTGDS